MPIQCLSWLVLFSSICCSASAEIHWPQWRGAGQVGVAPEGSYPTQWTPKQVRWQCPIPGRGGSTPIVWGNQAIVTGGDGTKNFVYGVDLTQGNIAWQTAVGKDRGGKHKVKGGGSHPSVVTDGESVFVYFRSGDIGCLDMSGKIRWQTNLQDQHGEDTLWWDLGTSPVLTDQAVVVAVMQTGPSYLVALDKKTGREIWKQDRASDAPKEAAQSYSTPLVTTHENEQILLVLGADQLTCHRTLDGKELWRVTGFNPAGEQFFRSIASPVLSNGIVVCPYARGKTLTGIRLADHQIAWTRDDLGTDVPTPAARNGRVYLGADKGHVECIDGATGKTIWAGDLPKHRAAFSSSPLLAGGYLYLTREDGTTFVLTDGNEFHLATENSFAEPAETMVIASPVPIQDGLLIRNNSSLFAVSR